MRTETVTANKLCEGDTIISLSTRAPLFALFRVTPNDDGTITLRSNTRTFTVLATTRFQRVYRSRRINMRPDLTETA